MATQKKYGLTVVPDLIRSVYSGDVVVKGFQFFDGQTCFNLKIHA